MAKQPRLVPPAGGRGRMGIAPSVWQCPRTGDQEQKAFGPGRLTARSTARGSERGAAVAARITHGRARTWREEWQGARALPRDALGSSPSDPRGVAWKGNDFGAGQAACWFICYGMQAVIHLESPCTATALGSHVPVRWQRAPCSLDLQICMPSTCHH